MLAFLGDIHGSAGMLQKAIERAKERDASTLIQVGDLGWFPSTFNDFMKVRRDIPVYWIDGNHEDFRSIPEFQTAKAPVEVAHNFFYVPRGTVLTLDGKTIAFMGGAASIDKGERLRRRLHWDPLENISNEEFARLDAVAEVDLLVTHCPPQEAIDVKFNPMDMIQFGVGPDWRDPNALKIQMLWRRLNCPPLICGHMHKSVTYHNVRILDINQLYTEW